MILLPKKAQRAKPLESEVLRRIREAVGALPYVTLWRNNTGMLEDRNGTKVRFGLCEGSSDLVGVVSMRTPVYGGTGEVIGHVLDYTLGMGRFFVMEVKQPGKKPTSAQVAFIEHVNKMGGYGCWVSSVSEALEHVEKARVL